MWLKARTLQLHMLQCGSSSWCLLCLGCTVLCCFIWLVPVSRGDATKHTQAEKKTETLLNTKHGTFLPAFLPGLHEYKDKTLFIPGFMYYTEVHGRRWYHAMKTLLLILISLWRQNLQKFPLENEHTGKLFLHSHNRHTPLYPIHFNMDIVVTRCTQ